MWSRLRNLLAPDFRRLEDRLERLERDLQSTLQDTMDIQAKTYRMHQSIVKREARMSEPKHTNAPRGAIVPETSLHPAQARILARRARGVHQGVPDASTDGEGAA